MAIPILIATASSGFGELIRKTLEDAGSYQAFLATNRKEVMQYAQQPDLALAILDSNLERFPIRELGRVLRASHPGLKLIVIPAQGTSQLDTMGALRADGFLNKPFYLPDFLSIIKNVMQDIPTGPAPISSNRNAVQPQRIPKPAQMGDSWQYDVSRAAQHLTRLSFEVSAQAALLVRDGQLWAYSGQLPQEAARELAQVVIQDRKKNQLYNTSSGDLARFIKLETTGDEIMLYATQLDEEIILALAFDAQTPFSRIRSQANQLARALLSPDLPKGPLPTTQDVAAFSGEISSEEVEEKEKEEGEEEPELQVPAMFPEGFNPPPTILPSQMGEVMQSPPGLAPASLSPEQASPANLEPDIWTTEQELTPRSPHPATADKPPTPPLKSVSMPPAARTNLIGEIQTSKTVRIENTKMYNLRYACVLIPRLPQHTLTGDLSRRMNEWMQIIHLSFGWRLAHLAIRPGYLLWISDVPPKTSAANLIKTVRKQTSGWVFLEFPLMEKENPAGEFWAPGYMATTTGQTPSAEELQAYIQNTRSRQGITIER
jgi:REP element-mobilizing transposase RayT/DNA-binding response OmpR family regulator